ncbi:hypothetical protein [Massilia sp. erpn]|uniref:hypothetical protein n=1 Tax=Massilia sp. erpn TaxID=2738142 RepID=UPI0021083647|nr:hypothetical protein [Massilia sp. erpn]UTY59814.1 hypothetical protein HPQ68_23100 [Massilia sp. erpn]
MPPVICKLKFKCPNEWANLDRTSFREVRFCTEFQSNVYFAQTQSDFEQFASEGKCIALIENESLVLGMPEGYSEPFVLVPPQEYTDKQLYLLKRILPFCGSIVAVKEMFYLKEVKIEDMARKMHGLCKLI